MIANGSTSQYVLGSTDAEQERLIRQAARLDPTERLFRDAGMSPVNEFWTSARASATPAMLAARLVGPSGEDRRSRARRAVDRPGRARVAKLDCTT
jgi:hypothetical protein